MLGMIGFLALGSIFDSLWEIFGKRKKFIIQYIHAVSKLAIGCGMLYFIIEHSVRWKKVQSDKFLNFTFKENQKSWNKTGGQFYCLSKYSEIEADTNWVTNFTLPWRPDRRQVDHFCKKW